MTIAEEMKTYCDNNMKELKKICYPMLVKIGGISNKDYDDFYSIALKVLADSVVKYDSSKSKFRTFLIGNIKRKFNTEVRDRNRKKRIIHNNTISIDVPINDDSINIIETISDNTTIETLLFSEGSEKYSDKMESYLSRLSPLQKKVLYLISVGFLKGEILEELHISSKEYQDCYEAIHSYRNTSILM